MKWKSWLTITAVSLSMIGCAPAADNQVLNSAYNGTGTGIFNMDGNAAQGVNPFTDNNGTYRDRSHPGAYANNSLYKDTRMGMGIMARNDGRNSFGYAEYSKQDLNPQQANTFYVDRNVLARSIGTVVTAVPGVEKAVVLATDEDLFVGVPGVSDAATLNQVKLSAWSMAPRWYKISVSGNQGTINSVKRMVNNRTINEGQLDEILKNNTVDMTGTNVTDNGQNVTRYNLDRVYPNTNPTHRMNMR